MSLEIKVGPQQVTIHQGHAVLLTEPDGQISWPTDKGLYFRDTRLISSWQLYANGAPWELLSGGAFTSFAARVFLTNSIILTANGEIKRHTLGLVLGRQIDGGVHEDIDLTNDGMEKVSFNLEISIRSDFADLFEVKSKRVVRRGRIATSWSEKEQRLSTAYRHSDFARAATVQVHNSDSPCVYANGRLSFEIELDPGAAWHTCLLYELSDGDDRVRRPTGCIDDALHSPMSAKLAAWRQHVMRIEMAEVFDELEKPDRARILREKAATLYTQFNIAFWDDELGFYAYALDADEKKVLTVTSNVGHCLWSGIVPTDRAKLVVERLMAPDMCSGWGIRTLSARHPAFNAYDYQVGAVWPHDNGLIAQGLRRYGYAEEVGRIAHDLTAAGSFFSLNQLPELYAGIQRSETNFPVQYLGANVPQAWAAGSVFSLLQAILGFQPDAPNEMLYLDPVLPPWMRDLTVRNLRVGKESFDIRFLRTDDETRFDVLKGDPDAVARRDVTAWSELLRHGRAVSA